MKDNKFDKIKQKKSCNKINYDSLFTLLVFDLKSEMKNYCKSILSVLIDENLKMNKKLLSSKNVQKLFLDLIWYLLVNFIYFVSYAYICHGKYNTNSHVYYKFIY